MKILIFFAALDCFSDAQEYNQWHLVTCFVGLSGIPNQPWAWSFHVLMKTSLLYSNMMKQLFSYD